MVRHKHLQLEQDLDFQRREWKLQRLAWALIAALLVAGLLGLFGSGPLSRAEAGRPGESLWVEYERFARRESPAILRMHLRTQAGQPAAVSLARSYVDGIRIEAVVPEPEKVEAGAERTTWSFRASGDDLVITFYFQPERLGRHSGRVDAPDGRSVVISQFVYP